MRANAQVHPGQVWRSSDPRRLSAFLVREIVSDVVVVSPLYPFPRGEVGWFFNARCVPFASFVTTGPKGYTRIS